MLFQSLMPMPMAIPSPATRHVWLSFYKMFACLMILLTLQDFIHGQGLGPRYDTVQRFCTSELDCNREDGETCWIAFSGCSRGTCKCDPRSQFKDQQGKCRNLKLGGDQCDAALDRCPSGMACLNGFCDCMMGTMTDDLRFCLKPNEKLLGQNCGPQTDFCYQKVADFEYKRSEVECSMMGMCRCSQGYKQENGGCHKWNIGEHGCTRAHHCHGGALCIHGSCQCPSGFFSVTGNNNCVRVGAKYELQKGDYCNEINQSRYCDAGLVCQQCPGEENYKCAQYLQAHQWAHVSKAPSLSANSLYLSSILAVCTVFSVLRCWLL